MDVELVYAQWKVGRFPSEELPAFAGDLMVAGWQGPAVVNLVSFDRPTTCDVGDAFDQVLRELGIAVPDLARCELLLAQEVARDVVLGAMDPCRGAAEICERMGWDRRCDCLWYAFRVLDSATGATIDRPRIR